MADIRLRRIDNQVKVYSGIKQVIFDTNTDKQAKFYEDGGLPLVEKTATLKFADDYALAYSSSDLDNFKTAENENKIIRVMYSPGSWGSGGYEQYAYYKCVLQNDYYTLIKINNNEIPLYDTQEILPDEGTGLKKVTILKPENLKSEYIKKDIDIGNVSGSFIGNAETCTVSELDFQQGPMELFPSKDHLFGSVNITPPVNLLPQNIREGIEIAGIAGTYVFEGLPTLNAPTAISDVTNLQNSSTYGYIRITNPTSLNGNFVKECQLFIERDVEQEDGTTIKEDKMVARKALSNGAVSYIDIYATDWVDDSVAKQQVLKAQFLNSGFKPSTKYSVTRVLNTLEQGAYALTKVNYDVQNLTLSKSPPKIYWGQWIQTKLIPNSGFYMPKKVIVESGIDSLAIETQKGGVIYDNTTGNLTIKYGRLGDTVYGGWTENLTISAIATDKPWLKDFVTNSIVLNNSQLSIPKPDSNAQRVDIKLNDQIIYSTPYQELLDTFTVANISTTYGFVKQSSGYYVSNNNNKANTCALARATFVCEKDTQFKITYINYAESSYDFGLISNIDTEFNTSTTAESSNLCLFHGSGKHNSAAQSLIVTIPAGTHTIDFKYKKDGSQNSGNDNFQFKIEAIDQSLVIDLLSIPELQNIGTYNLSITAEADKYIGTDPVIITYDKVLNVTVQEETLITNVGSVENETFIADYSTETNETLTYTI